MPWDNNNIYDPMSAVPGAVPAPRPAGQNPAATNYVPGRYAGVSDAIRGPGQFIGNVTGWQDRAGGQRGEARDARWYQNQVIQALQQQAAGDMNSQAQQQLRDSFQRARAQQASLGSTMRGQSAGAAMRSIQAGQQGISRGQAGEEQMLKLQEQEAARAMLAQLLAQQQGLDIRGAEADSDYRLGDSALADRGILSGLGLGAAGAISQGQQGYEEARGRLGLKPSGLSPATWGNIGQAANTATNTLQSVWGPPESPPQQYRTVDGQNSIVPLEDK